MVTFEDRLGSSVLVVFNLHWLSIKDKMVAWALLSFPTK